jgi:hypothetical protein
MGVTGLSEGLFGKAEAGAGAAAASAAAALPAAGAAAGGGALGKRKRPPRRRGHFSVSLAGEGAGCAIGVDLSHVLHDRVFVQRHARAVLNEDFAAPVSDVVQAFTVAAHAGISVVFVADERRRPTPAKAAEDISRAVRRDTALDVFKAMHGMVAEEVVMQAYRITPDFQDDVIAALREAGFTVVQALGEADSQLAQLYHDDVVDVVAAGDGDMFVHGCERVLWEFTFFRSVGAVTATLAHLDHAPRTGVDLDFITTCTDAETRRALLRIYAILAGCDYSDIGGVGPATAAKVTRALFTRHAAAAVGAAALAAAAPFAPYREPHIEALLTDVHNLLLEHSAAVRKDITDGALRVNGAVCTNLRAHLSFAYYAFTSPLVYSFHLHQFIHIGGAPPAATDRRPYNATDADLAAVQTHGVPTAAALHRLFGGSADELAAIVAPKKIYSPRYLGATFFTGISRYIDFRFTAQYARLVLDRELPSKTVKLNAWASLVKSTHGGLGRNAGDIVHAVRAMLAEERFAVPRKPPLVRPPAWRPPPSAIQGGPAPSPAQRLALFQRARAGLALPHDYDPTKDLAEYRAADDAAAVSAASASAAAARPAAAGAGAPATWHVPPTLGPDRIRRTKMAHRFAATHWLFEHYKSK